jgi:hypothetical protein
LTPVDRVTFEGISSPTMSLPRDDERRQLDEIAFDLREAFDERGHRVDVALDADPAFGSGVSRSALMRDLVLEVVGRAASRVGLACCTVNGGGRELVGEGHRYRVRRARRDANGSLVVTASSESSLCVEEEPTLFPMESWVFGWVADSEGLIAEVFAAKILRFEPGKPGRLVLGHALPLGGGSPFGGGFTPSDEDLDLGMDDEDTGGAADDLGA